MGARGLTLRGRELRFCIPFRGGYATIQRRTLHLAEHIASDGVVGHLESLPIHHVGYGLPRTHLLPWWVNKIHPTLGLGAWRWAEYLHSILLRRCHDPIHVK